MIGGMDSFDAVLDRVSTEREEAHSHGSGRWTAMRGWNSSFVAAAFMSHPWPSRAKLETVAPVDAAEVPTPAARPEPAIDTSPFTRVSPEAVAKDINLLATDTPAELKSKRRSFARINHPDRVPMEWRQAATTRMKIANHMVDEALRRL